MWSFHVYYFRNIIVLHSFCLSVTVNAASVFSEVKFLDYLHRFFDGVADTFHRSISLTTHLHWSLSCFCKVE